MGAASGLLSMAVLVLQGMCCEHIMLSPSLQEGEIGVFSSVPLVIPYWEAAAEPFPTSPPTPDPPASLSSCISFPPPNGHPSCPPLCSQPRVTSSWSYSTCSVHPQWIGMQRGAAPAPSQGDAPHYPALKSPPPVGWPPRGRTSPELPAPDPLPLKSAVHCNPAFYS